MIHNIKRFCCEEICPNLVTARNSSIFLLAIQPAMLVRCSLVFGFILPFQRCESCPGFIVVIGFSTTESAFNSHGSSFGFPILRRNLYLFGEIGDNRIRKNLAKAAACVSVGRYWRIRHSVQMPLRTRMWIGRRHPSTLHKQASKKSCPLSDAAYRPRRRGVFRDSRELRSNAALYFHRILHYADDGMGLRFWRF